MQFHLLFGGIKLGDDNIGSKREQRVRATGRSMLATLSLAQIDLGLGEA